MTTDTHRLTVSGINVEIVRKDIKNLHLGVYPPEGRVRVAAPLLVNDEAVRLAVIGKLAWIKRQQAKFAAQSRQSARRMVSGESHYFQGQRYRLRVIESSGKQQICLRGKTTLELSVRPGSRVEQREAVLLQWYRDQLRIQAAGLLEHWQALLGVQANAWGIRRMKTQWGSCNTESRRLWLNLELAKKPPQCVEYIVVHELMHLRERHHNARFVSLMNQYLPSWELMRALLNHSPLAQEEWN